jgi:hypothetical protein
VCWLGYLLESELEYLLESELEYLKVYLLGY